MEYYQLVCLPRKDFDKKRCSNRQNVRQPNFYFDDAPMQILANVKPIDFDMKRFLVRLDHNLLQFFTYLLV